VCVGLLEGLTSLEPVATLLRAASHLEEREATSTGRAGTRLAGVTPAAVGAHLVQVERHIDAAAAATEEVKCAVEATGEGRGDRERGPGAVQTILVVDDDSAICDTLALLLEDAGYMARSVPDGLAALDAITEDAPDLVITDLYMPGLDGPGLIARLQSERPDLPLIVLSAGIRASPQAGAPFIAKPFDAEHLLATVARLLAPSRPQAQSCG
jgi:CheY-like chemotaxis protein